MACCHYTDDRVFTQPQHKAAKKKSAETPQIQVVAAASFTVEQTISRHYRSRHGTVEAQGCDTRMLAVYARCGSRKKSMLILTRRIGESLMIGDEVTVTVLEVKGHQVRIGIKAPKHVSVHREEIFIRIKDGVEQTSDNK